MDIQIELSHRQIAGSTPQPSESAGTNKYAELCLADFLIGFAKEQQLIADTWQAVVNELLVNESIRTKDIAKWKTLPDDIRRMQIEHYNDGKGYKDYSIILPLRNSTIEKEHKPFTALIRSFLNRDRLHRKVVQQELNEVEHLSYLNQENKSIRKVTLIQSVAVMHREAAEFLALANKVLAKSNS
jgi:hypothetical protein